MSRRVRTFIAAEISGEVQACVSAAVNQLSKSAAEINWVRPEAMHLTIKFLGDVDYTDMAEICRSLEKTVADIEPIEVECGGVGAFPKLERPRTLWLGIDDTEKELARLAEVVEDAMADLRFRRESRPFHPHLTLGRVRDGRETAGLAELIKAGDFSKRGGLVIEELVVFSSELTREGPIYQTVGRAEFGG